MYITWVLAILLAVSITINILQGRSHLHKDTRASERKAEMRRLKQTIATKKGLTPPKGHATPTRPANRPKGQRAPVLTR